MCLYASDKSSTDFSLKMHQKCLAAGLCLDPLDLRGGWTIEGEGKDRRGRDS